jgi:uncharacterized Zn finger protein
METVFISCPFCLNLGVKVREETERGYSFRCLACGKIWSEPYHTINLNKYGENGYIKPRRK